MRCEDGCCEFRRPPSFSWPRPPGVASRSRCGVCVAFAPLPPRDFRALFSRREVFTPFPALFTPTRISKNAAEPATGFPSNENASLCSARSRLCARPPPPRSASSSSLLCPAPSPPPRPSARRSVIFSHISPAAPGRPPIYTAPARACRAPIPADAPWGAIARPSFPARVLPTFVQTSHPRAPPVLPPRLPCRRRCAPRRRCCCCCRRRRRARRLPYLPSTAQGEAAGQSRLPCQRMPAVQPCARLCSRAVAPRLPRAHDHARHAVLPRSARAHNHARCSCALFVA